MELAVTKTRRRNLKKRTSKPWVLRAKVLEAKSVKRVTQSYLPPPKKSWQLPANIGFVWKLHEVSGHQLTSFRLEMKAEFKKIDGRFSETDARFIGMEGRFEDRFSKIDARFVEMENKFEDRFSKIDARFVEMENKFEDRFSKIDARFVEMENKFEDRFSKIDSRFVEMENKFEDRFSKIDARFAQIDLRFAKIDERFAKMEARMDRLEAAIHALGARMERIEAAILRLTAIIEEQNHRNRYVMDGYSQMYQLNSSVDERLARLEESVFGMKQSK